MLRNRRKSPKPISLDITTFPIVMAITVAIMLFLYMTLPTQHGGMGLDLPIVDHMLRMTDAERADAMVVAITHDGKFFFGVEQVTADQLAAKIGEQVSHGGERKVFIRADGRVRYDRVCAVLDGVRSAGIGRIGILADQRPDHTEPNSW